MINRALFLDDRMQGCLDVLIELCKCRPEGIGFNEWRKVVTSRGICSLRTFQKNRTKLVEGKLVMQIKNPKHSSGFLFSPLEELRKITDFISQLEKMPEQMKRKMRDYKNPSTFFNQCFTITILYTIFGCREIAKRIKQPESRKMLLYYVSEVLVKLYDYLPKHIEDNMRHKFYSAK